MIKKKQWLRWDMRPSDSQLLSSRGQCCHTIIQRYVTLPNYCSFFCSAAINLDPTISFLCARKHQLAVPRSLSVKHTEHDRRKAVCGREEQWLESSMPQKNSKDNSVTKPKPGPGPHSLTWVSPPPLLAWSLSLYVPLLWSLTCQDAVL